MTFTRASILPHARAELAAREASYPMRVKAAKMTADEAGRALAAWRAIVALLENADGTAAPDPCLGPKLVDAWLEIVTVVDAAVEHRLAKCDDDPGETSEQRLGAMAALRRLVRHSAVRAGLTITAPVASERIAA